MICTLILEKNHRTHIKITDTPLQIPIMAATGDTAVVLLKSPKDWTRWLALIKTKAVNNNLWQHIDPSIASPPAFEPPTKPLPAQFVPAGSAETATVASLTAAQFQRYNAEILVLQEELKDHRKKVKAITEIEDHVIRTAGTYWSTIESVTGLHARLVKLKERVAPLNYAREQEIIRRYERVRTQADSTRIEEWLAEWESTLRDAIELNLPDIHTAYQAFPIGCRENRSPLCPNLVQHHRDECRHDPRSPAQYRHSG